MRYIAQELNSPGLGDPRFEYITQAERWCLKQSKEIDTPYAVYDLDDDVLFIAYDGIGFTPIDE
ncbi:MAG: hypothetical protein GY941_13690 [Planctomycetes bacterium]|nr:hypothetical protein [Planctomycetota bacterium]